MFMASFLHFLAFVSFFVQQWRRVIESLHTSAYQGERLASYRTYLPQDAAVQSVRRSGSGGVILADSRRGFVDMAECIEAILLLRHAVGDHVVSGAVVAEVVGSHERDHDECSRI
jgi:hypothetical protein